MEFCAYLLLFRIIDADCHSRFIVFIKLGLRPSIVSSFPLSSSSSSLILISCDFLPKNNQINIHARLDKLFRLSYTID